MRLIFSSLLVFSLTLSSGQSTKEWVEVNDVGQAIENIIKSDTCSSIFIGESHYRKANSKIFVEGVIKSSQRNDFGGVILEDGYCTAYLINEFYKSNRLGFTDLNWMDMSKSTRDLKTIKKRLSRVGVVYPQFYGVDYEHNPMACIRAITILSIQIDNANRPDAISNFIDKQYEKFITTATEETMGMLISDYKLNKTKYEQFFGAKFSDFIKMLSSYNSYQEMASYDFNNCHDILINNKREEYIRNNIGALFSSDTSKVWFGQFGLLHTVMIPNLKHYMSYCHENWSSAIAQLLIRNPAWRINTVQLFYRGDVHTDDYLDLYDELGIDINPFNRIKNNVRLYLTPQSELQYFSFGLFVK